MAIPAYRLLFYSAAIVIFGVMGQAVARGWLARELTGNNAGLGGVMLVFGASMLITTPLGGVAADRYDKRRILIWSVVTLMVSSTGIGIAVVTGTIAYWMLLVAGGLQAGAFAFYLPARVALLTEVVPGTLIQNAIVISAMAQEAMRVFAPAIAGVMIGVAWFGVGGVFLAAGVTAAIATVMVMRLAPSVSRPSTGRSPLVELIDAVSYMRSNAAVGRIALLTVVVVMVGFPYLTFLPTLADERYGVGATGFGLMSAVAGLGAVTAGMLDATLNAGTRPWRMIIFSGAGFGAALILLGVVNSYLVGLLCLMVVGATALIFQTSSQAVMLRLSPLEYHGRLQSMVILGFSGFGLAALPLGLLADAITLDLVLIAMGVIVIGCAGLFTLFHRRNAPGRQISVAGSVSASTSASFEA
jgi:predicted MFS family arabinose efflux permease